MPIDLYPNIAKVKRGGVYQNLPGFVRQNSDADIEAMIANSEISTTAQYAHPEGSYFILNDILYKAIIDIAVNDTIAVGTNCEVAILCNDINEIESDISDLNIKFNDVVSKNETANLFDEKQVISGFLLNGGTLSTQGSFANYKTSDYIELEAGQYIIGRKPVVASRFPICVYNTNKVYQSYIYSGNNENQVTFTLSEHCYIRFSMPTTNGVMLVSGTTLPNSYVGYGILYINEDVGVIQKNDKRFEGKRLINFGDSIAEYRADSHNYASQFCDLTGAKRFVDVALSGATMSYIEGQTMGSIVQQVQTVTQNGSYYSTDVDIILIDGGANDISQGRNVGSVVKTSDYYAPEDYTATFDRSRFIGALEDSFKMLRATWVNAIIVFVIPHKHGRYAGDWNDYLSGMRECCEKWSVAVLDMDKDGELNTRITAMRADYTDEGGTHPNTLGIKKFYLPKLVGLLNNYFNNILASTT